MKTNPKKTTEKSAKKKLVKKVAKKSSSISSNKLTKKTKKKPIKKSQIKDAKQISNPNSTGGEGIHFENRVQSAFTVLLLANGYAPTLPNWPIIEIQLQGKYLGYATDDIIVFCKDPTTERQAKLLGQIKHSVEITKSSEVFGNVIKAAWDDFNNPKVFSHSNYDAISLITGPLAAIDTNAVRQLLIQARDSRDASDFIRRIELGKFTSNDQRKKLDIFKYHLKAANGNIGLTDEKLLSFLKSFHLLIYDLDIKGITLSLLQTIIAQYSNLNSQDLWAKILDHIQWVSEGAGSIRKDSIPEDIVKYFKKQFLEQNIPKELLKDTSKIVIKDWNSHSSANELMIACLIGSWNENSNYDKSIISNFVHVEYEKWIYKLREILQIPDCPIEFKNGIWKIKDRKKLLIELSTRVFDNHIEFLKDAAISILSERDPKFELQKENRFTASVYGKVLNYSNQIRKGFAESLALVTTYQDKLENCSSEKIDIATQLVVKEVFQNSDWITWASLGDLIPLIAEAAPDEFLNAVDDSLQKNPCPFDKIYTEEGNGFGGWNYMTGILWALETLAWNEIYLVSVSIILGELASRDPGGNWVNRPANSLTSIFLPWMPQTLATVEKRKVAIQNLEKEFPDVTWKLLLTLLPKPHQISTGSQKPVIRNWIPVDWNEKILYKEFWELVAFYAELTIEKAKNNFHRLNELIKHLDNLPIPTIEKLLAYLSSSEIVESSEDIRQGIWQELIEFATKNKRFSDAKWALESSIVEKIVEVACKLEPKDPILLYAHLFVSHDGSLFEEKGDWQEQSKNLDIKRQLALKVILDQGSLNSVFILLDKVEAPLKVGQALGSLENIMIDEELLPHLLNKEDRKYDQFIEGYVWNRFFISSWSWVDKILSIKWTKFQIAKFMTLLPFTLDTWLRVGKILSSSESLYWKGARVNPYQTDCELTIAIDKLIEYGRPHAALDCINKILFDKNPLDITRTVKALLAGINSNESPNVIDSHNITEIIKVLHEDNSVLEDDLMRIEWGYLKLLDGYNGISPKYLHARLSNDSIFFCNVIQKIYKSKKVLVNKHEQNESEKAIATNAWHLLYHWKTPPGKINDGQFDGEHFKKWLKDVKTICKESGHFEVAQVTIGQVLFYTPADPSGFWINITVAEELNRKDADKMRNGFSTQVFNSRGAHWIDPSGKPELELAAEYKKKAEETENQGFPRFAVTLRKIAEGYEIESKRIIEEHKLENLE